MTILILLFICTHKNLWILVNTTTAKFILVTLGRCMATDKTLFNLCDLAKKTNFNNHVDKNSWCSTWLSFASSMKYCLSFWPNFRKANDQNTAINYFSISFFFLEINPYTVQLINHIFLKEIKQPFQYKNILQFTHYYSNWLKSHYLKCFNNNYFSFI